MMNFVACAVALIAVIWPLQQAPYQDFTKAGAGFYGEGRDLPEPADIQSVRIGVLGPEKGKDGLHLRAAVAIALEEANARGGYTRRSRGAENSPGP